MFSGSILVDVLRLVLTERRHVFKASIYVHWHIILFKKKALINTYMPYYRFHTSHEK